MRLRDDLPPTPFEFQRGYGIEAIPFTGDVNKPVSAVWWTKEQVFQAGGLEHAPRQDIPGSRRSENDWVARYKLPSPRKAFEAKAPPNPEAERRERTDRVIRDEEIQYYITTKQPTDTERIEEARDRIEELLKPASPHPELTPQGTLRHNVKMQESEANYQELMELIDEVYEHDENVRKKGNYLE